MGIVIELFLRSENLVFLKASVLLGLCKAVLIWLLWSCHL